MRTEKEAGSRQKPVKVACASRCSQKTRELSPTKGCGELGVIEESQLCLSESFGDSHRRHWSGRTWLHREMEQGR
jgi:hypothetical protein